MTELVMKHDLSPDREEQGRNARTGRSEGLDSILPSSASGTQPAAGRVLAGTAAVRAPGDIESVLRVLLDALERTGFTPDQTQSVQLAVREAILNAIEHGHKGDPTKQVRIRYLINPLGLLTQVEDEGLGFRPDWVEDSQDSTQSQGRGLRLMRQHMTEVRYNASGNCVTLIKRRKPDEALLS
jgi:serine/threonine-protein kinase RsbW